MEEKQGNEINRLKKIISEDVNKTGFLQKEKEDIFFDKIELSNDFESVRENLKDKEKRLKNLSTQLKEEEKDKKVALDLIKALRQEKEELNRKNKEEKKQLEDTLNEYKNETDKLKKYIEEKEKVQVNLKQETVKVVDKAATSELQQKIEKLVKEINEEKEYSKKLKVTSYYNFGVLYANNAKYDDAIKEYNKALEIDPDNPLVHYNLGVIYDEYKNRPEKAVLHYEKYLQFKPDAKDAEKVREWLNAAKQKIGK